MDKRTQLKRLPRVHQTCTRTSAALSDSSGELMLAERPGEEEEEEEEQTARRLSEEQLCVLCQLPGVSHLCARCGVYLHPECHIPPVTTKPRPDWLCLLCEVVGEKVVLSREQRWIPIPSQRKQMECEKLFGALCDDDRFPPADVTQLDSKVAVMTRQRARRERTPLAELVSNILANMKLVVPAESISENDGVSLGQTLIQIQMIEFVAASLSQDHADPQAEDRSQDAGRRRKRSNGENQADSP